MNITVFINQTIAEEVVRVPYGPNMKVEALLLEALRALRPLLHPILRQVEYSVDNCCLMFAGEPLKNSATLAECDLKAGEALVLSVKPTKG